MADFNQSLRRLGTFEKGYANNPHDSGGETYAGISRKNWPAWDGWAILDSLKSEGKIAVIHQEENERLQTLVAAFYRDNFWHYGSINNQDIANKLFDIAVNDGLSVAHKLVQRALSFSSSQIDGKCGPDTIAKINSADPVKLLQELRARQAWYYAETLKAHPEDEVFALGWMRRAVA